MKNISNLKIILICTIFFSEIHLFAEAEIKVDVLAKSTQMWDGTELPDYPKDNPEITIIKVIIPPGKKLPMHKHPVINAGYVLSGKLTVYSKEGNEINLEKGDSLIELVNKWHFGKNVGDEDVEIVVFYAGQVGTPITIKE